MKKLIAISALAFFAAPAFSANVVSTGASIVNGTCAYIPSTNTTGVKLTTSANVAAAYECTSTGVVTGAAHTQGKKKGFINSSAGGTQKEATLSANPGAPSDDITTLMTGGEWTTAVNGIS